MKTIDGKGCTVREPPDGYKDSIDYYQRECMSRTSLLMRVGTRRAQEAAP